MDTACAICNSTDKVQNHHIKAIKHSRGKFLGYKGFDKLVASLGRKQIPTCEKCNVLIHKGAYDGMGLNQLYDIRLVAPESYIRDKTTKHQTPEFPSFLEDLLRRRDASSK